MLNGFYLCISLPIFTCTTNAEYTATYFKYNGKKSMITVKEVNFYRKCIYKVLIFK